MTMSVNHLLQFCPLGIIVFTFMQIHIQYSIWDETVKSSNSFENELHFRTQIAARSTSKVISVNILRIFRITVKDGMHASSVLVFQGMSETSRVITFHACKFRVYVPYVSNRM
jgi:hypothetical protein